MITEALLRAMRAEGLTPEQILRIIERERVEAERIKRENERSRSHRYRLRQQLPAVIEPTQIPTAWHPTPEGVQRAAAYGCEGFVLDVEVDRFRNYYLARGRVMTDWDACWANWVASPFFMKGSSNGKDARTAFLARWDAALNKLHAASLLGAGGEADASLPALGGDQS